MFRFLSFLPMLGAAAVVMLAQTQVRGRSEKAALLLTIGGGLEAAYLLARFFLDHWLLHVAAPLVQVGAAGAVAFGLMTLIDELNPKRAAPLSATLVSAQVVNPSIFSRVFYGGFGVVGILATGSREYPLFSLTALLALAAVMVASVWLERQGPLGKWILERRPELVVWSYVYQLRVVNRKTGSSTTHWSAQLGLSSGSLVPLPALGETGAQTLVAAVSLHCPGVALGFTPENSARFKASPATMRGGPRI